MTRPSEKKSSRGSPTVRKRRWWRFIGVMLVMMAVMLIAVRLALPSYLRSYVNRTLDQSPDYDGTVGEIDVHLWRGAYTINDLEVVKITHAVAVPFVQAKRVDFSLDWGALMHGEARGKMTMEKARLNFVQGPSDEESQSGADQPWLAIIHDLYPFRIDRADFHDSEIHFQAFHMLQPVDVYLSKVEGSITNLTNIENKIDPLMATATARGVAMESGDFQFQMKLDPNSHRPHFDLATRLLDMDVTKLNALSMAFAGFDFESGRFDLTVEISTRNGFLEGYAKPLFRNLSILSMRDVAERNPLQVFWEALVGLVGEVFKNQPHDQFGTRISLRGDFDNPRTNLLEIVGNVLHNAFVRAFMPTIEGRAATDLTLSIEPE